MENRELHPNLQAALQLVEGIFQMLGSRYEVILHDLSHVESSIVACLLYTSPSPRDTR